jgi:two-component system, response regulator PdtaR
MLFGRRKRNIKRILIIEDEPLTAFDNECMIRDAGYEVVATHDDYEEAVAALDRGKVDLILSDVRLRGDRTGIELAEEAKARGVPVLFVTGNPPDNACDLAIGCLTKPYTERTLRKALDAVDRVIGGKTVQPPAGLTLFAKAEGETKA